MTAHTPRLTVTFVALFKSIDGVTQTEVDEFLDAAKHMEGKIPGLVSVEAGSGLNAAAPVAQGFDWGVIVTLEKPEDLPVFEQHPTHAPFVVRPLISLRKKKETCYHNDRLTNAHRLFPLSQKVFQAALIFDFEPQT